MFSRKKFELITPSIESIYYDLSVFLFNELKYLPIIDFKWVDEYFHVNKCFAAHVVMHNPGYNDTG